MRLQPPPDPCGIESGLVTDNSVSRLGPCEVGSPATLFGALAGNETFQNLGAEREFPNIRQGNVCSHHYQVGLELLRCTPPPALILIMNDQLLSHTGLDIQHWGRGSSSFNES